MVCSSFLLGLQKRTFIKHRANGRNIVVQTLLDVTCFVCLLTLCCMCLVVVGNRCAKFEAGHTCSYVQTDATIPNIIKPKTLGVVCISVGSGVQTDATFPNEFPTIMLGPALHFGKNTTHKTLKTTCNERALPLSSWKSCANGSIRDFKIQRRGRQRERQRKQ